MCVRGPKDGIVSDREHKSIILASTLIVLKFLKLPELLALTI